MKTLGNTEIKITKSENGENESHLEITEAILVYCNIINNNYQQDLRVLYTFTPNKSIGELLNTSPNSFMFLKSLASEFLYIELWLTDQNSKPLEREDGINMNLVISYSVKYKKWRDIQFSLEIAYL